MPELYSPPWEHSVDECFVTEIAVPLYNPMENQTVPSKYWTGPNKWAHDNLTGDDSRVIMDRALEFIERKADSSTPFLICIWFHAPHAPVAAGEEDRKPYSHLSINRQHYYGCVSAMDKQVGRLNDALKNLGLEDDTMVCFCSDNGPEGRDGSDKTRYCGSTGGLRGRKQSLFNGGICVPAFIKWPGRIEMNSQTDIPCSTLDYFPTIINELGYKMPDERVVDGIDIRSLFNGNMKKRGKPIPFRFVSTRDIMFGSPTFVLIDEKWKLLTNFNKDSDMLFNLIDDPYEQNDVSDEYPEIMSNMVLTMHEYMESFAKSHSGNDYNDDDYKPINDYIQNTFAWIESEEYIRKFK